MPHHWGRVTISKNGEEDDTRLNKVTTLPTNDISDSQRNCFLETFILLSAHDSYINPCQTKIMHTEDTAHINNSPMTLLTETHLNHYTKHQEINISDFQIIKICRKVWTRWGLELYIRKDLAAILDPVTEHQTYEKSKYYLRAIWFNKMAFQWRTNHRKWIQ